MKINYETAEARARQLWSRNHGPNATSANGTACRKPGSAFCDVHAKDAVSFNLPGAIYRAIEEQVGPGNTTERMFSTMLRRLDPCGIAYAEYRESIVGRLKGAIVPDTRASAGAR